MITTNLVTALERNKFNDKQVGVVKFFSQAAIKRSRKINVNDYAIFVIVHLKDRKQLYTRDMANFHKSV